MDGDKVRKVDEVNTSDAEPITLSDAALGEPLGASPVGLEDSVDREDGEGKRESVCKALAVSEVVELPHKVGPALTLAKELTLKDDNKLLEEGFEDAL